MFNLYLLPKTNWISKNTIRYLPQQNWYGSGLEKKIQRSSIHPLLGLQSWNISPLKIEKELFRCKLPPWLLFQLCLVRYRNRRVKRGSINRGSANRFAKSGGSVKKWKLKNFYVFEAGNLELKKFLAGIFLCSYRNESFRKLGITISENLISKIKKHFSYLHLMSLRWNNASVTIQQTLLSSE